MDGWMVRCTDEWTDGWTNGLLDGRMDQWMNRWMDEQTDGQIDGWTRNGIQRDTKRMDGHEQATKTDGWT